MKHTKKLTVFLGISLLLGVLSLLPLLVESAPNTQLVPVAPVDPDDLVEQETVLEKDSPIGLEQRQTQVETEPAVIGINPPEDRDQIMVVQPSDILPPPEDGINPPDDEYVIMVVQPVDQLPPEVGITPPPSNEMPSIVTSKVVTK